MTRYSIIQYRWVEIIVAETPGGNFYKIPNVVDKHGTPYSTLRLPVAKQMISRVLHGNSQSYRYTNKFLSYGHR